MDQSPIAQLWPCPLFRPRINHTCHHKPNPSRDTVPIKPENVAGNVTMAMQKNLGAVRVPKWPWFFWLREQ